MSSSSQAMDSTATNQSNSSAVPESTDESNKSIDLKSSQDNVSVKSGPSKTKQDKSDDSKDQKFKKVESRYKQSTQQWVNKRNESSTQEANKSRGQDSRNSSRNPTPDRQKKTSTPRTTGKVMNISGVSAINKPDDNGLLPEVNKYGKPLITGRRSLAPRKLGFQDKGEASRASVRSRNVPMTVGLEETKKEEFMTSIANSVYIQSAFLLLKAKIAQKARREDALDKMSRLWNESNKIRDQIMEVQELVHCMEDMLEGIDILEKQESSLKEYLAIREQTDQLFNELAELIRCQKRLVRIENCSDSDFEAIQSLKNVNLESKGLERTEKATISLEGAEQLLADITSLEKQLEEHFAAFGKCVTELDKYHRIEGRLKRKSLSLKKLF